MCATTSNSSCGWKVFFRFCEAVVVVGCLYGFFLRVFWPFETAAHPIILKVYPPLQSLWRPIFWFWSAMLLAVLAGPLVLSSQRRMALETGLVALGGIAAFLVLFIWPW
jgi:hypothetical protein